MNVLVSFINTFTCHESHDRCPMATFELVACERHKSLGPTLSYRHPTDSAWSPRSCFPFVPYPAVVRSLLAVSLRHLAEVPSLMPSPASADPPKSSLRPQRAGDLIYWRPLTPSGETLETADDSHAREVSLLLYAQRPPQS